MRLNENDFDGMKIKSFAAGNRPLKNFQALQSPRLTGRNFYSFRGKVSFFSGIVSTGPEVPNQKEIMVNQTF